VLQSSNVRLVSSVGLELQPLMFTKIPGDTVLLSMYELS